MEAHSPKPLTTSLDELSSNARWLRSLAFQLVRDPDAAEDLSQEVLHKALAKAPRDGRPLRPWLGTVLRNAWRERNRTDRHRIDREQRREVDRAAAPTDELVAKVELERKLAGLVLELAEPYRSTLLLRFWEGLEPAAIAHRLEVPAGTIRWRLKRGLDQLRARLDAHHEGRREEWIAALAPLWKREAASAGAAGSLLIGTLVMTNTLKILTLAAAGALALWLPFSSGSDAPEGVVALGSDPVRATSLAAPADSLVEAAPDPREPVAAAVSAPVEREAAVEARAATVSARILDKAGTPVAGATFRGSLYGYSLETESGGDGRVQLSSSLITREEDVDFLAVGPDKAAWVGRAVVKPGENVMLGDLQLAPRASVSVRVSSGILPPRGATVVVQSYGGDVDAERGRYFGPAGTELGRGQTGLVGTARVDGILPGRVRVWAGAKGKAWAWTEPFELSVGEHREGIALSLAAAMPARGVLVRVVDTQGARVARCRVRAHSEKGSSSSGSTDDRGESRISFHDSRVARVAVLGTKGDLGEAFAEDLGDHPPEDPLILVLDHAVSGTISASSAHGEPLEQLAGSVRRADDGSWLAQLERLGPFSGVSRGH